MHTNTVFSTKLPAFALLSAVALSATLTVSTAYADKTVIEGPGFKMENKKGWFGTSERTYKDALGNTYVKKKGLFGREKRQSRIFGSQVEQNGQNVTVTAPNGTKLIERKKGWFGSRETRINGNSIWDSVSGVLKSTPANTSGATGNQ